jgi:regulator of protease activity HflC (stomatin/prohibitin superfamily)
MKSTKKNPWLTIRAFMLYAVLLALVVAIVLGSKIVHYVDQGTYVTKQSVFSGKLTATMKLGWMGQWFAEMNVWPTQETLYFTEDIDTTDDVKEDNSIPAQFNDGGKAKISSTLRITMPSDADQAASIVTVKNIISFEELQRKLVRQYVRKCQRRSAFLMNSRESFRTRRTELETWTQDQINNGPYVLEELPFDVNDASGAATALDTASTSLVIRKLKMGPDGEIVREDNPFEGTGITLDLYEIKDVNYLEETDAKIQEQMEHLMDLESLKIQTLQEAQRELQNEAKGRASAMEAKWEEEEIKAREVVKAEMLKELGILDSERTYESSKLERLATEQKRLADILEGEGQAKKKRLILEADGALQERLVAFVQAQAAWAKAYSMRAVPKVYFAGGAPDPNGIGDGSGVDNAFGFGQAISLLVLDKLDPDLLGVRADDLNLQPLDIPERELTDPNDLGIQMHERTSIRDTREN